MMKSGHSTLDFGGMIDYPYPMAQPMRVPPSLLPSVETDEGAIRRGLIELANYHGVRADPVSEAWGMAGTRGYPSTRPGDREMPFEIFVALGRKPGGLRYLSEVGGGETIWERLSNSRRALPALLELLGLRADTLMDSVDLLLPEYIDQFPRVRHGIWVSPVFTSAGGRLNTYVNTGWRGLEEVWPLVHELLDANARAEARQRMERIAPLLRDGHRLSFIGLETTQDGIGRIGLHFRGGRLTRELVLRIARLAGDGPSPIGDLWERFIADRTPGPEDTLLSIMIPEDGTPMRVRIEISADALGIPDAKLLPYIHHVARAMSLDPEDYVTTMEVMGRIGVGPARHTTIGLSGMTGEPEIDIFIKPRLR
ncbi:MAG: hypothetical protein JWQ98_1607 [Chlorobi bacterium]|nr:hypothetical protein [Chlorobiota bacterium]